MPIYHSIIADIEEAIEKGQFKRGEKLPSIRQLSQHYHCSKDTVQKALLELKYQHKIYAVPKSGYYILEDKEFQEREITLNPKDFHQLPYEDFRTCLHESLVGRENYLFNYYHQHQGLEELILSLQKLFVHYHVYAKKEQIAITAGSQQALYILTQLLRHTEKKSILIEDPTYPRMQALIQEQGLSFKIIPRTLAGIDLQTLETLFQREDIQYFYTIPRLHNPLGTTYSLQEKKEILRLAQTYDVYVIEDDYLADFDRKKQVPFHYLDTQQRVIYIKSFTPTLFPALRIGGVVLPDQLLEEFLHYKGLIDYDTNLIMQKALSLYIDNGMFAKNTQHLMDADQQIREAMEEALASQLLPFPHHVGKEVLILELPTTHSTAAIKHSQLPIHILHCQHQTYLFLSYRTDFKQDLSTLLGLLTA